MASTITVPQSGAGLTAQVSTGTALSSATATVNHTPAKALVAGTSATQISKIHSARYLVTTGTPLSIDLTSVTDPVGASLNFGFVSRILISNASTTAGQNATVLGGTNGLVAASPFTLGPGGHLKVDLGDQEITVDGTHKIITVTLAAGTNVPIDVTVMGR
jgi:hypothetical protein